MSAFRVLAALFLAAVCGQAAAQVWPSKPIRMIVPNGPGASPDLFTRLWADRLSKTLGQQVVVENNIAGTGIVGAQQVARSAPDGYTLFLGTVVVLVTNPLLYKSLPYDPVRDFTPIAKLVENGPYVVAVHPDVPVKTFPELIKLAKSQPGKLSFAADAGLAGIAGRWLTKLTGIDMVHIPYKQIPPSLQDAVAGRVPVIIISLAAADGFVKAGKLRVIGVSSAGRFPGMENVPAIAETVPGFQVGGWFTIVGPTGLPADIVSRLNRETDDFLKLPEVRERLRAYAFISPGAGTPESTAQFIRTERARWTRIAREVGVTPQ